MEKLTLDHKKIIENKLKAYKKIQSELNFTNLFAWRDKYDFHFIQFNDTILIVNKNMDKLYFSEPLGEFSSQLFEELQRTFNLEEIVFKKCSPDFVDQIQNLSLNVETKEIRDDFDYLYLMEDLRDLKGNAYHKKKNHVNQFLKNYEWSYESVSNSNIQDIRILIESWFQDVSDDLLEEKKAIHKVLENWEFLNTTGGILYVKDIPVAFTIGEFIDEETLLIHFEKGLTQYTGVYPMIMQQYLLNQPLVKYVNREQDLGIPGLRKAKESYHPVGFVKKYNVSVKG
ncbi:MAG: DUF2156 domain-containing protein [Clostridia bacterium]|nr:DUF2156 domain-containing protein [Clostridia bacterium]